MHTFNILDPKTNIFQNRCLEASAGTGKTFAIEHLFVRLLLESNPSLNLLQILAVTFTRDATREMKLRIRKNLEEAQKSLEGKQPSQWPYLQGLTFPAEALKRVRQALSQIDELQIFTIHGFCHRMLGEFSLQANMSLLSGSSDQYHYESSMREVVEDFLHHHQSACSNDLNILLAKMRWDVRQLIQLIIKEMQKEDSEIQQMEWTEIFSSIAEPNFHIPSFVQDFITLAPRYKRLNLESFLPQVELCGLAIKSQGKEGISQLLKQKTWFLEKMHEENVKAKAPTLEQILYYPHIFAKLQKILLPKLREATNADLCLKRIGQQCRRLWNQRTAVQEQFSPDGLLQKMNQSLQKENFAAIIRKNYQAVIIDEFQDTDPIQWSIFRKLFLHQPQCLLYLVGDPKQSIYGFRNADIYTYMQATEELGKQQKAILDINFRSCPELIKALNAFFTKSPRWLDLPNLAETLSYHSVKAGRTEGKMQGPPLQFFLVNAQQGKEKSWPPKHAEEKHLFPYIGAELIRVNQEENIPFEEMAILVKDRFQAWRLQEHLQRWNIPVVIQRNIHLAETTGFFVMEQFLRAAISLSEPSICNFLLLIGFCKKHLEEHPQFLSQVFHIFSLLQKKKFCEVFTQFLQMQWKGKTIEEFLIKHQKPSFLLSYKQTAEILVEKAFATPQDLLQELNKAKNVSMEENPLLQFQGIEKSNSVKIMTVFASKGLEFDIVFALGVASGTTAEEDDEEEAEKMRELYVALTRAKEKLYVPFVFSQQQTSSAYRSSALSNFFAKCIGSSYSQDQVIAFLKDMSIEIKWIEETIIQPMKKEVSSIKAVASSKNVLPTFPHKTIASFSALSATAGTFSIQDLYLSQDFKEKTLHTLPLGTETGIIIHAIFEQIFLDRSKGLGAIVQQCLDRSPLQGWEEVIEKMVEDILQMPLFSSCKLKDLTSKDYFHEMEFLFSKEDQLIKGFADLIFQWQDKYYLLDWKTNWLGTQDADYTEEKMRKAMVEHDYFLQARLYSEALKRYVKLFDKRPFTEWFGGAIYVFLRGKKIYYVNADEMVRSNLYR